jgi:hypothetical protein
VLERDKKTRDTILCMMGEMMTYLNDTLKTTEPLPMLKVTPPIEILDTLRKGTRFIGLIYAESLWEVDHQ